MMLKLGLSVPNILNLYWLTFNLWKGPWGKNNVINSKDVELYESRPHTYGTATETGNLWWDGQSDKQTPIGKHDPRKTGAKS